MSRPTNYLQVMTPDTLEALTLKAYRTRVLLLLFLSLLILFPILIFILLFLRHGTLSLSRDAVCKRPGIR